MAIEATDRRRLRVFISAYACSPHLGSEPGVGWGFVSHLAERYELDVVAEEEKFREDIIAWTKANPNHPASRIRFHFIRKKRNRLLRKIWPPSYYWYLQEWHRRVERLAKTLDAERNFQILHQLTMVGFREPGYLWRMDKPFVWGPIGGTGTFPMRFHSYIGLYGMIYYAAYNIWNSLQIRFLNRPRNAARKAGKGLIFATSENLAAVREHWGQGGTILSEVGDSGLGSGTWAPRLTGSPLKIIWSGQHIPRKALNLGLKALCKVSEDVPWELHVLGEGPQSAAWESLAESLGVLGRCVFYGNVPRDTALSTAANCHVAFITSLRDLTSTVTIESLELGLPVIAPYHCGFADAITNDCGILVSVTTPQRFIDDAAVAIETLARNEALRSKLAQGALKRAKHYAWANKADQLAAIYEARLAEEKEEKQQVISE